MRGEEYIKRLWEGDRRDILDRLLFSFLCLLSIPYALALRFRAFCYRMGVFRSRTLDRPVISVGNITVGGTGKTPTTIMLAKLLMIRGKRVAVLSRGYRSKSGREARIVSDGRSFLLSPEEAGDEPYLMARSVPGLMVITGADRYGAGLLAQQRLKPDIFILDDGFQHLRLRRDLNILLLDCRTPFGNNRTLPAGFLREPVAASARADIVIHTRCQGGNVPVRLPNMPSCRSMHVLTGASRMKDGAFISFDAFAGKRGLAFTGIADPPAFFDALRKEGLALVATQSFCDHVAYGEEEIETLCRLRDAAAAEYLITTEKDAVKLTPWLDKLGEVHAALLDIRLDDLALLEKALEKVL
ncbi:MAG: tetraacyldisaccharide 4'-kinase [Geobacter sp.]|nr:tetraacyldisaccharide 4'-kinase [Geobacter sp.]